MLGHSGEHRAFNMSTSHPSEIDVEYTHMKRYWKTKSGRETRGHHPLNTGRAAAAPLAGVMLCSCGGVGAWCDQ